MFELMNEARIGVAIQGLAAASSSHQYARSYARERIQGSRLSQLRDANAERVAIVEHPDVRRMLMTQKVLVEAMRSMCYRLALDFDLSEVHPDEAERERRVERVDLLVPVAKAACTDLGFDVAVIGVQIFGGYGFTKEFPVEQIVRDAKIQSIYEGTNGIQALDLLGRKMRAKGGKLFMTWIGDMQAQLRAAKEEGFAGPARALEKAIEGLAGAAMHIGGIGQKGEVDLAMSFAVPFTQAFGWVALGMESLDQARAAKRAIDRGSDAAQLRGKLLNLDFFVSHLLPRAGASCETIRTSDGSCLDPALFGA
jgi:hypothetical protein